jgi:serine/threonine protein kinase/Tol biopolymer transport system component
VTKARDGSVRGAGPSHRLDDLLNAADQTAHLSAERRREVTEIVEAVCARDPSRREALVAAACGEDLTLRHEVQALLTSIVHGESGPDSRSVDEVGPTQPVSSPGPGRAVALVPGERLGTYEVIEAIGAGGMGELYRALDTRLGRHVALKILPPATGGSHERLARFRREARVLASLNHPNIAAIYGLERSHGFEYLVLELVEGVRLKGPLPVAKALDYACQIAEALETAHRSGILHRDLKPANIIVTPEGRVKVLDFGLAKLFASGATDVERLNAAGTMTTTIPGLILGTAAYMSPEQANGALLDARSDIFAFGALLYEMLTGKRAFPGETASEVLAALMLGEPDWSRLPADTPPPIRRLLQRCLQKDRHRRLHAAGDARIELEDARTDPQSVTPSVGRGTRQRRPYWSGALAIITLVVLLAAAWMFRPVGAVPEMRLDITTAPTAEPLSMAISPDGRRIVFVATADDGRSRLWLRPLNSVAQPLLSTDGASYPFWSPDGRSIGFFSDGRLKRLDLEGGSVQTLAAAWPNGGTWSPDGTILFAPTPAGPLVRIPAAGGDAVPLTKIDVRSASSSLRFPRFLPDGRRFLFYTQGSQETQGIYLGSLDSESTRRLTAADTNGDYLPSGWLLFIRRGALVARRFDPSTGNLSGEPVTVADAVGFDDTSNAGAFAVSPAGLIAYRSGGESPRQLTWFDRAGNPLGNMAGPDENQLMAPALAPDGRRVLVHRTLQNNTDLWLLDGARAVRFTSDPNLDRFPIWSADGSWIAFGSNRRGARDIYRKSSSGAGVEELLLESAEDKAPNSWSPDGHFLMFTNMDREQGPDLYVLPLDGDQKAYPFLRTPFDERVGQFSPDGRWVAYQSNESGPWQIYVRPFPGPGGQSQVSTAGGIQSRWRADGKELYYIAPDGKMMAVPIAVKDGTLEPGVPAVLFQTRIWGGGTNAFTRQQYDVAPDGRFLINVTVEGVRTPPITMLLNWRAPAE